MQLDPAVHGPSDVAYRARAEASHELGATTALLGISLGIGSNATGPDERIWLYGVDLFLKWRPETTEAGWPFVAWQIEFLWRDFGAPSREYRDWGFYTQVVGAFRRPWTVALRISSRIAGRTSHGIQKTPCLTSRNSLR